MPQDLFLMKILLKKEVCGFCEQCTEPTRKALLPQKCASQKKEKEENADACSFNSIQTNT